MSAKAKEKYGDINFYTDKLKVPAQSLHPPDKDGFLTKQGGSIKTWKRRYVILKGQTLYYYKTPKDQVFKGKIDLEPNAVVKEEPGKGKKATFSVSTAKRIFFMYPDRPEEAKGWIDAITSAIEKAKPSSNDNRGTAEPSPASDGSAAKSPDSKINGTPDVNPTPQKEVSSPASPNQNKPAGPVIPANGNDMSPRVRLSLAKQVISFLKDEESKVLEFWQIWSESIPSKEEISVGGNIEFQVAASADMHKITWRTSGPQNIFIQKMVDFFWNVGAPESEIDRLNDVGASINPVRIGSWIDMSSKGGMDGGWYFPVDVPLALALEAADSGEPVTQFNEWAKAKNITSMYAVGRDMGAAPPRQTEFRMKLSGDNFEAQLETGLDAFKTFNFPAIPTEALNILRGSKTEGNLNLSIITSSEGFVRIGLMVPNPSTETVLSLCGIAGGNNDEIASFEGSLGVDGPSFVEYQYLQKGFGYGVYKEGFDIVFHYFVGEDSA